MGSVSHEQAETENANNDGNGGTTPVIVTESSIKKESPVVITLDDTGEDSDDCKEEYFCKDCPNFKSFNFEDKLEHLR